MVAGGMESMTSAPIWAAQVADRHQVRHRQPADHMAADGLWDVYTDQSMGALTDRQLRRGAGQPADQDAFAARSHQRAAAATASGVMAEELVEVKVPQRRGPDRLVATDEGIREGVTAESLAGLPPAFAPDGTITAASSSPIRRRGRADRGQRRGGRATRGSAVGRGSCASVAVADSSLQLQPAEAIRVACAKEQIGIRDLDLIEINEAFAAVGVASARALGLNESETDEKVNINGGAIALGHLHRSVRRPARAHPGVRAAPAGRWNRGGLALRGRRTG